MERTKSGIRPKNSIWFLIVLTLVVSISYAIGIDQLSFYGDDWIYIYNYHIAGAQSFPLFTRTDRPHSAWIYILTSALFGESALAYHILMLALRWLSAFLFWRVLADAFGRKNAVYAAVFLFAVYPGFQQQPIAVEFIMHFTSLVLVLLSIRLMQITYFLSSRKRIALLILSLASGMLAIFTCEYFIGLELARPLFLYFTIQEHCPEKKSLKPTKKLLSFYIPYLFIVIFYFIWRIFIFSFTTYAPKLLYALQENFLNGIRLLVEKIVKDLITVLVSAYRMVFTRPANVSTAFAAAILLLAAGSVFCFMRANRNIDNKNISSTPGFNMLLTGCALLLFSGIPYWGTFLDISTEFPWDRSTLSFSPGAAVLIAALLEAAFKPLSFCIATAIITAFCTLFQVQNTQEYIIESKKMNDYFWQLAWRMPQLDKGTILVSEDIPLDRTSDNDLTPIVNWQYAPENRGLQYDYKYFDLHLRESIYYAEPGKSVEVDHIYRSHSFLSSTEKTLVIYYKKSGCLQVLDSSNNNYPDLPESLRRIASISDIDLIQLSPENHAVPPAAIGPEPEHDYCYYFQKTTLAQQNGKNDEAYELAAEALRSGLHPVFAPDLAPVVLAFLEAGDIQSADKLITAAPIGTGDVDFLCNYWQNGLTDKNTTPELQDFYTSHGCL